MLREGDGVDKARDRFCREIDWFDFLEDDTSDNFAPEGDKNEVAWSEFLIKGICKGATAVPIDLCRDYLKKHTVIIARHAIMKTWILWN